MNDVCNVSNIINQKELLYPQKKYTTHCANSTTKPIQLFYMSRSWHHTEPVNQSYTKKNMSNTHPLTACGPVRPSLLCRAMCIPRYNPVMPAIHMVVTGKHIKRHQWCDHKAPQSEQSSASRAVHTSGGDVRQKRSRSGHGAPAGGLCHCRSLSVRGWRRWAHANSTAF